MKLNRLFEITTVLLNKGSVTAKELADRFGVSTRTIYRDVDVLSSAGVPVYMSKGNGGGIALLEDYALNRTIISDQESESLLLAVRTLQVTNYPDVDVILEKMGALFKNAPPNDWIEIDFSAWSSTPNEQNKFNDIRKAMLERKVIRFEYVNGDGKRSCRFAEPEKLLFKGYAWYLIAFCRQRRQQRIFRMSRIKNVEISEEKFTRCPLAETACEENKAFTEPLVPIKMRFQPQVLNRLYDEFDDAFISKEEAGHYDVTVSFPENEWLYNYILSFGAFVEVLEPPHIRANVAARIRQAVKIYEA
ncbi:YafY family protein [Azotosporobacter soli]|uniref:helix-turn-helix transcriptional regulator n=1 Tax=Azotosporobacter soli TaxID=3055040 RepID=UPI0031FF2B35